MKLSHSQPVSGWAFPAAILAALLIFACPAMLVAASIPVAQAGLGEAAAVGRAVTTAADVAREKDVVWLSLVCCIVGCGLAGWLVVVVVRQAGRHAELVEKAATAMAQQAAATAQTASEIREMRELLNDNREGSDSRPRR